MVSGFGPTIKSRSFAQRIGSVSTRSNGLAVWGPYNSLNDSGTETITSQCHAGTWPPRERTDTDVGGIMTLNRSYVKRTTTPIDAGLTRGDTAIASVIGYSFGSSPAGPVGTNVIEAFGTSAVAAVLPTNPNASLATAIGELRKDGLPSLPGSDLRDRVSLARKAGGNFLNIEFGWLPLVDDLKSFADSVKRSRQLIDQYRRDSDRKIRRRFTAMPLTATSVYTGSALWYSGGGGIISPNCTVSKETSTRYWFSGAFRYHVPVGDDFYSRLREYESLANHLFGTRITPELVWNLAPWSWAVDWFTNAGDVIHNISLLGVDGLVMHYGYAMRHQRSDEVARGAFSFTDAEGLHTGSGTMSVLTESKQRVRANPYGFGVTYTSLSAKQNAILVALGLTQGKRDR